jgi:HAD superfamily hydrolase (TIGR01549 family)
MIKAAIFDIDGTLVDSVDLHAHAWQEAFAKFGHEVPFRQVRQQIGKGGDQLLPVFLTEKEIQQSGEELEEYRGKLFNEKYLPLVKPFPHVRELFLRLKHDGKQIVLASSAKGDEIETYKRIAHLEDLVQKEASSDDVEQSKPHPDIFEAALQKLHEVEPQEAIAVGDSPYDAIAAGKLEIPRIGVLCGGFPENELRAAGCSAIYNDCADLLEHYSESLFSARHAA